MVYRFQYQDEEDRVQLIVTNEDKYLIEEQNITEGNFLIFTDEKPIAEEVNSVKTQLQTTQEAIDFLIMSGGM